MQQNRYHSQIRILPLKVQPINYEEENQSLLLSKYELWNQEVTSNNWDISETGFSNEIVWRITSSLIASFVAPFYYFLHLQVPGTSPFALV
jgi:hypothetical protein